jgi:pimeloyl-ACP methyl ester carboxylesterase
MLAQDVIRSLVPIFLIFSGCNSAIQTRVKVAQTLLTEDEKNNLRDSALSKALGEAALASDRQQPQKGRYNIAVEKFILALQKRAPLSDWSEPLRVESPGKDWIVTFEPPTDRLQSGKELAPCLYTRIFPAYQYKVKDCENLVANSGYGTPLVLALENIDRLVKERPFRPRIGIYLPGTAILEFGRAATPNDPIPVRLRIINTFDIREAPVAGRIRPLAYNISAPIQISLDNKYIRKNALEGLLRPDKRDDDIGLFGITAYSPKKIPVIFTHGLKSDAHIWKQAVNEIFYDPALAARYQPVLFLYPSGLSVPASAARLRKSLQIYRNQWDPEHDDPGMNQMIVVGHSMGGILSRLQVIDSGEDLRKSFFSQPIDSVPWLTKATAASVKEGLIFDHQPFVKRAIFIAVPHRGSEVADLKIVQLAIRIIKLPGDALSLATEALTDDFSALNPALLGYNLLGLRSVDMLSPGHPYFKAIDKRPILVPHHSIIGDRGKNNSPDSSDGIVPYSSSHLDTAQSELIVPYPHSCAEKPETVHEILRILRLHAGIKN